MPEDKKASPKGRAAAGVKDWGTKRKRTSWKKDAQYSRDALKTPILPESRMSRT